jgi:hypothetical protein
MRLPILLPVFVLCTLGALPARGWTADAAPKADSMYSGMCEASAAVAVDKDHFLVANDEDNVLRLYQVDKPEPVDFPIGDRLGLKESKDGIDIEGAAVLDGTAYWITSHSRSKKGKIKPDRLRFFAAMVKQVDGKNAIEFIGSSPKLLEDLLGQLPTLGLDASKEDNEDLAPEELGNNIEGLAAGRNGGLLIGFRNPVPEGKALIVPLENPREVFDNKKAKFGAPIRLDLGGLGIRSIERMESGAYLIVAGPSGCGTDFRLFRWSGNADQPEDLGANLSRLAPEAIVLFPERAEALVLSDDGDVRVKGKRCQDIPAAQQKFRGRWVPLPTK